MADRWPAAALTVPRGLTSSSGSTLDVESAGIVRASAGSPLNILHVLRAPLGGLSVMWSIWRRGRRRADIAWA